MGGKVFDIYSLSTPRMPPHIYHQVQSRVHSQLLSIYTRAETPIEGPGKTDHGDVDFITFVDEKGDGDGERNVKITATPPKPEDVAELIGAVKWHRTPASTTTHYALPWPEDQPGLESEQEIKVSKDDDNALPTSTKDTASKGNTTTTIENRYIQVDINTQPTLASFRFLLYLHSHGDINTILGATLRPFGFVSTPEGLFLKIPELEIWHKNLARVKLTDDPDTVLKYLGMDVSRYHGSRSGSGSRSSSLSGEAAAAAKPFKTWDEAITYASTCRFYDPTRGKEHDDHDGVKEKLDIVKAHDRSKAHKRPMLRYWFEEYLPRHRADGAGSASHMTRGEVVEDAKSFFGPVFAREWDRRREHGMRNMREVKFWSDLRKEVGLEMDCQGPTLTFTMKGLRFEVVESAEGKNRDELTDVQAAFRDGRFDEVKEWAGDHWRKVGERQEARDRVKSTAKLLQHRERVKAEEGEELSN